MPSASRGRGLRQDPFLLSAPKEKFLGLQKKRRLCAWLVIADKDFRRTKSGLSLRYLSAAAPALLNSCIRFSIRRLPPHRDELPCRRPRGCLEEDRSPHQRQRRSGLVNSTFSRRKQKYALKCAAVSSFGASKARFLLITRKRLIATASRREGVYNRAGEPSVTFCGEEERRRERAAAKDAVASGAESATTTQRRKWRVWKRSTVSGVSRIRSCKFGSALNQRSSRALKSATSAARYPLSVRKMAFVSPST